jgi:hypothetical protein
MPLNPLFQQMLHWTSELLTFLDVFLALVDVGLDCVNKSPTATSITNRRLQLLPNAQFRQRIACPFLPDSLV